MRRHLKPDEVATGAVADPNHPWRSADEPPKLTIPEHLEQLQIGSTPSGASGATAIAGTDRYQLQPARLVVPVSDLVANLLRPCYSCGGLGAHRTFFFEDEPVERKTYWAACFFRNDTIPATLKFLDVRFDPRHDCVRSLDGADLAGQGLQWAAALVPLVKDGRVVSSVEIAQNDYDMRQIVGRRADKALQAAYATWPDGWDAAVASLVQAHQEKRRRFEVFYHSVLAIDRAGAVHIRQVDATLPGLAQRLARSGVVAAGLLDSGGSCALYDPWLEGYLNHGWYYREPRGAILVFELKAQERLPEVHVGTWSASARRKRWLEASR